MVVSSGLPIAFCRYHWLRAGWLQLKAGWTRTGLAMASACAQKASKSASSRRRPAIDVPIAAPTAPAATASAYMPAARPGACIGRLASQCRRSGAWAQNSAIPSLLASHRLMATSVARS